MSSKTEQKLEFQTKRKKYDGILDPVHLLQTCDEQEMLLLESADIVTKLGEKSLALFDMALRIEARENHVIVTALLEEAVPFLSMLKVSFKKEIIKANKRSLTLSMEPLYGHIDVLEKMRARSALDVLRQILSAIKVDNADFKKYVTVAGTFSYDFLDHFEKLPNAKSDVHDFPNYLFYVPLTMVEIDHKTKRSIVVAHGVNDKAKKRFKDATVLVEDALRAFRAKRQTIGQKNNVALKFTSDIPDAKFGKLVEQCKEHINAGDVYQIVPSRTFSCSIHDPILSYKALRTTNPSPYMFYVRAPKWTLFGASPETFIKVDKDGSRVSIRPIAGTRRRGFGFDGIIDEELDSRAQASLCLDEKELAEHMMLVDLARNDIASVSKPKSRRIKRLLTVDRFSHVMHLVSEVEGELLKGFDALSAYQASMNMGTLMGAPKVRAAELLRNLEATKRGFYGGAVGYLDLLGNMDTAIIIRSALVKGKTAHVRAGCGVVYDSNPQLETDETLNKAEAVLRAISLAGAL